ncbi:MAG: SufS family cysteine desulfurase [Chthoniobacterales bacterium]
MSEGLSPAAVAPLGGALPHADLVTSLFREVLGTGGLVTPATTSVTLPNPGDGEFGSAVPGVTEVSLPTAGPSPLQPPPIHPTSPAPLEAGGASVRQQPPFGEPLGPVTGLSRPEAAGPGLPLTGVTYASLPGLVQVVQPEAYSLPGAAHEPLAALAGLSALPHVPAFDVEAIRADFPALHQNIHGHPLVFLDNAATTQKPQAVIDATSRFYARDNSNIHRAAYELAERATAAFEGARKKVAHFLGAKDHREIVFTRNATEAINLVAQTFGRKFLCSGDEILLTRMEHHANIVPWQLLAAETGAVIKVAPINDRGELILEEFARLLGPRTKIVALAHVSNALGTINPLELLVPLAHAVGAHVLIDGSQSTPHLPVNVTSLDADFFVFSGHKVFGPTGIGALYAKSHILELLPPYQGGGHMIKDVTFERTIFQAAPEKFEAGTPDIAGAVGLGAALDYLNRVGLPAIAAYEHALLDYASGLLAGVPGLRPIGTAAQKASVLSFVIPGLDNKVIAEHLDRRGIAVRSGHHCALPAQRHFGLESTVRPSLAFYNTRAEVDLLVQALYSLTRQRS